MPDYQPPFPIIHVVVHLMKKGAESREGHVTAWILRRMAWLSCLLLHLTWQVWITYSHVGIFFVAFDKLHTNQFGKLWVSQHFALAKKCSMWFTIKMYSLSIRMIVSYKLLIRFVFSSSLSLTECVNFECQAGFMLGCPN